MLGYFLQVENKTQLLIMSATSSWDLKKQTEVEGLFPYTTFHSTSINATNRKSSQYSYLVVKN